MKFAFNQISSRRTPLMGLAALLIYFAHAYSFVELPSPLSTLFSFGNIGVDIFLLVGGFGIYYSLVNTASKSSFYWKRLIKVGLPFLLISIPYFFIFDFFVHKCIFLFITNLLESKLYRSLPAMLHFEQKEQKY